jgi:hypothetical protein
MIRSRSHSTRMAASCRLSGRDCSKSSASIRKLRRPQGAIIAL